MLLRTMISMESESTFSNVAPRGSLQRFVLAGAFNSLISLYFGSCFDFFPQTTRRVYNLHGAAWALASFLAHFVHRWFTTERKSVQWTIGFPQLLTHSALQVQHIRLVWLQPKQRNFTNAWNSEHACMGRYYLGYPAYSCLSIQN